MSFSELVKKEKYDVNELSFESTPLSKIIILSVLTSGCYEMMLFYNWWRDVKNKFGYKISPFWRCVFCVFTCFSLFSIFNKYFKNLNSKEYSATLFAFLFLLFNLIYSVLSFKIAMLSLFQEINTKLEIISYIILIFSALIMVFIQYKINKINLKHFPNAKQNDWKISNIFWAIFFLLIIGLKFVSL